MYFSSCVSRHSTVRDGLSGLWAEVFSKNKTIFGLWLSDISFVQPIVIILPPGIVTVEFSPEPQRRLWGSTIQVPSSRIPSVAKDQFYILQNHPLPVRA